MQVWKESDEEELTTSFSHYKAMGIFFRCSRAANSPDGGQIWSNFELLRAFMHVIVTCKYDKDRMKNSWEKVTSPFLAHLSQRLIGELIGYPWSGVRWRLSVVRRSQFQHLLLQNRLANQSKFYLEPPWEGGTKVCSRHLGHMTNMAATPIYDKNPSKIFFSRTGGPISTKLGM